MSKTLYKYTSARYIDSILKNGGRLKLSSPDSFNDPDDCFFGVSEENLDKSFRMLKNVAFICEMGKNPAFACRKIFKNGYELTRKSVYVTHIYTENPAINVLMNSYLKSAPALSDHFKKYKENFDKTYKGIVDNIRSQALIGSLTKDNKNKLMWAHYADKHEGICVEYEFNDEKDLLEVVYTDNKNNFDLYTVLRYVIPTQYFGVKDVNPMEHDCLKACYLPFLRKTKEWYYEKETRVVFNIKESKKIIEDNGVWFYPNVKVKSIYLGCKVNEETRKMVRKKCDALKIPVHQVVFEKGNHKLIIKD